jgi:hypothetical protein
LPIDLLSIKASQPMPADQRPWVALQRDDVNETAQSYVVRGDILIPVKEIDRNRSTTR